MRKATTKSLRRLEQSICRIAAEAMLARGKRGSLSGRFRGVPGAGGLKNMEIMRVTSRSVGLIAACAALLLSACSQKPERPRGRPAPAPAAKAAMPSEALWHVRIGLNVAALSCRGRGREPVAGAYRRVLSRHVSLLKAAHDAELKRHGVAGYDRYATRLYNRFANQRSAPRFCSAAAEVARRAAAMNSPAFAGEAPAMLNQLRRWAG